MGKVVAVSAMTDADRRKDDGWIVSFNLQLPSEAVRRQAEAEAEKSAEQARSTKATRRKRSGD